MKLFPETSTEWLIGITFLIFVIYSSYEILKYAFQVTGYTKEDTK